MLALKMSIASSGKLARLMKRYGQQKMQRKLPGAHQKKPRGQEIKKKRQTICLHRRLNCVQANAARMMAVVKS